MPGEIAIRSVTSTDVEALSRLAQKTYTDAFGDSMAGEELVAHLEANLSKVAFADMLATTRVLVAEAAGEMIGFVQFGPARYPEVNSQPGDFAIHRMYVSREFQSRGLGGRLMTEALDALADATRVFLDVWEKNAGAIRFYERFGFEVVGERRFVFPSGTRGDLDLIMRRARSMGR